MTQPDPWKRRRKPRRWPTSQSLVNRALLGAASAAGALPLTLLLQWLTTR
ncbi:hypothetical protein ACW14Y_40780 [Kitasatospora sp. cg17-2]